MANSTVTHAVCSDITPNRCNLEFAGTYQECREWAEDNTDDTSRIMPVAGGVAAGLVAGESGDDKIRAHHDGTTVTA